MEDSNKRVSKLVYLGTSHLKTYRLKEVLNFKGFKDFESNVKPGDIVSISKDSLWYRRGLTIKTYLEMVKSEEGVITVEDNVYLTNFPIEMFMPAEVAEAPYLFESSRSYDIC